MSRNNSYTEEAESLAPWFHNLHLPDGTQTAPDHFLGDFPAYKWKEVKNLIPADLSGWSVLDVGCNAGFYSFKLAERGASVTGIDLDPHYLKQAQWAAEKFGLHHKITFRQMQVYDLAHTTEKYDLVWFMGVLYHLRYPLLGLDILANKVKKMMVLQTLCLPESPRFNVPDTIAIDEKQIMLWQGWPKAAFIEKKLEGDPTNWWAFTPACVEALLRSCGMKNIQNPAEEIFTAEPDPDNPAPAPGWNRSEYLSAIGKQWEKEAANKVKK